MHVAAEEMHADGLQGKDFWVRFKRFWFGHLQEVSKDAFLVSLVCEPLAICVFVETSFPQRHGPCLA